jgi:choline dehydrogenase-like flavoprotein
MITDFNRVGTGALQADVCIVGGGAAGISLALAFANTDHRVLLLESGGMQPEEETQNLYQSDVVGLPHHSIHDGRARVFGGTTTRWAGQALPLSDLDFRERAWVPYSGWPFGKEALAPYYRRAEQVMNLNHVSYDAESWPARLSRPQVQDDEHFSFSFSQFSATPNFATTYRRALERAQNVRVVLHANVTNIETDRQGTTVEGVEVRSLAGKAAVARARYYVICCGGIETARLLLASNQEEPNGVGNRHGLVGRFFQEHLHMKVKVEPADRRAFQRRFNTRRQGRVRYFPKLVGSPALQRQRRILSVAADVCYEQDSEGAVASAKRLARVLRRGKLSSRVPAALWKVASRCGELLPALYRYFVLKHKLAEGGPMHLCIQSECAPNPDSRVRLGREVDALGMRRAVLDWQITDRERRTIEVYARRLARAFRERGIGEVDLSSVPLPDSAGELAPLIDDASHHMGTTRAHEDPHFGVVNGQCRVHGVDNLYIGSSSVFPTGGFSNPTLTIIALCLRIADQLKEKLT